MMEFFSQHDVLGRIITVALILVTLCGWEAWVMKRRENRRRCPHCKGEGRVVFARGQRRYSARCLVCDGKGVRHAR